MTQTNAGAPAAGFVLRAYQLRAVADIMAAIDRGCRRILYVSPTASGKTVVLSEVIRQYVANHRPVAFIAHRHEIIKQTGNKLAANGIPYGIIQADIPPRPMAPVQVCSIATLASRLLRSKTMEPPPARLAVVDEAHHVVAHTWVKTLEELGRGIRTSSHWAPPQLQSGAMAAALEVSSRSLSKALRSRN
jgi:DNA repair protein RadD